MGKVMRAVRATPEIVTTNFLFLYFFLFKNKIIGHKKHFKMLEKAEKNAPSGCDSNC